jgi:hypothetical protein
MKSTEKALARFCGLRNTVMPIPRVSQPCSRTQGESGSFRDIGGGIIEKKLTRKHNSLKTLSESTEN